MQYLVLGILLGISSGLACERSEPPQTEPCGPDCREALQRAVSDALEQPVHPALPLPRCAPGARTTLIYGDPERPPLREETDCNRDGRPDRWIRFAADGSESEIEIDTDFDGNVDVRTAVGSQGKPEAK